MNTGLPHRLDEGILIEDGNVLLGWNSSRDVLLQVSQPATEELPGGRLGLLWLTAGQWHELKNYLLDLQFGGAPPPPAALLDHPIVQLALRYRETRNGTLLDQAAAKLVGTANQAWLALDKS